MIRKSQHNQHIRTYSKIQRADTHKCAHDEAEAAPREDRYIRLNPPSLRISHRFVCELMDLPDEDLCAIMRTLLAPASGGRALEPDELTEFGWAVYDELQPAVSRNIHSYLAAQQEELTARLEQFQA